MHGQAPVNLPAKDLSFGSVRVSTNGDNTSSSGSGTNTNVKVGSTPISGATSPSITSDQQSNNQAQEEDSKQDDKPFFSTSNPVFLAIFAALVLGVGLGAVRLLNLHSSKEDNVLPGGPNGSKAHQRRLSHESSGNTSST